MNCLPPFMLIRLICSHHSTAGSRAPCAPCRAHSPGYAAVNVRRGTLLSTALAARMSLLRSGDRRKQHLASGPLRWASMSGAAARAEGLQPPAVGRRPALEHGLLHGAPASPPPVLRSCSRMRGACASASARDACPQPPSVCMSAYTVGSSVKVEQVGRPCRAMDHIVPFRSYMCGSSVYSVTVCVVAQYIQ
jgi:hypothetical protein